MSRPPQARPVNDEGDARERLVADLEESQVDAEGERPGFRRWRVAVVAFVFCMMFGAVIARAYHIQVGRASDFSREAASQLEGVVEIHARRGAIYDREGREMAISVRAESIFAHPRRVTSPREAAAALAPVLGRSEVSLFETLTQDRNFVWLSRRVAPRVADVVRSLDLPGIDTTSEWQRFYPMRHRAGHLLGFTGDDGYGLEGVERAFDGVLAGGAMEVRGLRDALGRPILSTESPELQAMEGASIVLTLDARIQRVAERELERVMVEEQARTGVIVVMDPQTGEVLAMTSWPPFDPNRFRQSRPADWRNRAVTDAWEPGSTLKIFTYAGALDAGLIRPDTEVDCGNGRIRIGRYRIRDHVRQARLPALEVIQLSSNIGTYRIGGTLGDTGLYETLSRFGFGEPTGLGLGGEQSGLLEEPPWAEVELANRAFGQGVTVTPIQLVTAYSAIANGGELLAPLIVREIRNKDGDVLQRFEPVERRRVISERTAQLATEALEAVTREPGTGVRASLPGIAVAGKTGTAQKVDPETGEYADLWMASFVGFVPADDPMFTILVVVDEPQVGHFGGDVAAPVFARVAEQALAIRGVFVERQDDRDDAPAPEPPREGPLTTPAASAPPLDVDPLPAAADGRPARVIVPDLTGLSLGEALVRTEAVDLDLLAHDWGLVARQWPVPGASVLVDSQVDVYMTTPYALREPRAEDVGRRGEETDRTPSESRRE